MNFSSSMHGKAVGIIGYGHFGQFVELLVQRYIPTAEVRVARARTATSAEWERAAQADVVIVCVAIRHYIATLERLRPLLGQRTVLVDVATVKELTTAWCQEHAADITYLATHPMFGPASYEKSGQDVQGFRLVVTSHNLPADTFGALSTWLRDLGLCIIEMDAAEHDRYLAETLFLTHFVAQTITEANFVRTDIDTVSFGFLMDAVESVRDDRTLFQDVYAHNPYCATVVGRVAIAARQVQDRLRGTSWL